ncbi:MAG TPA: hypothetical protein VEJ84_05065, partial [Acidimicrobiales bacterium]|nr:hypothetical protein [Acidimicrobiales bacterium]
MGGVGVGMGRDGDGLPRLLAIMGSGETTPTMAKVHRQLFDRLGPSLRSAVLVDTPYGFQSNAADISARAVAYFRESTGRHVEVASLPRAQGAGALEVETALAKVGEAQWVFSGPGSPTYALAQWRLTTLPSVLAGKLRSGGCVVLSSAAALTLGRWTVPVYEIYKAGADPTWVEGLDLLSLFGWQVAVITHFDNAEGGTHDTRYCYLGEGRLRAMERQLPPEGWVLGVDEHTACIFDLDAGTTSVVGLGAVSVRRHGETATVPAGQTVGTDELAAVAAGRQATAARGARGTEAEGAGDGRRRPGPAAGPARNSHPGAAVRPGHEHSPLEAEVAQLNAAFDD